MSEKEFWKAVKEFQEEFEQLKHDIERVNAIRLELERIKQTQG